MASAWGKSWAKAWGNAWGSIAEATYQPVSRAGGGGYLVELDGKRKQETIYLYDEEQEIMEILAAIVPVIELNQRARM